jgi:membrane protease YdiL (CAAX protease family)
MATPDPETPAAAPSLGQGTSFQSVSWAWWDGLVGIAFLLPARYVFLFSLAWLATWPQWLLWSFVYLLPVSWRLLYPLALAYWRLPTFRPVMPGLRAWLREGLIALVLVGTLVGIQAALYVLLAAAESSAHRAAAERPSSWTDVVLLVSSVTLAPLTEEVFFRGLIFNWLKRFCPLLVALVVQGIIFGFFHPENLLNTAWLCFFGFLLGVIYQWRQTLLTSFLFHALKNTVAVIAASMLA